MIRMNEMTWMEFKAKIDEGARSLFCLSAPANSMAPICRCV